MTDRLRPRHALAPAAALDVLTGVGRLDDDDELDLLDRLTSAGVELARIAAHRRDRRPNEARTVACAHCGTEFDTTHPRYRFCSTRCRWDDHNARQGHRETASR